MRYAIHQTGPNTWELRAYETADKWTVLGTFTDGAGITGYDLAMGSLSGIITEQRTAQLAAGDGTETGNGAATGNGLLPERWTDDQGLAFSRMLDGGRDFTECAWSWRDPSACLVPLMFQTETDYGHFGAELAGFAEELSLSSGTVHGAGRFYDSEVGTAARDVLLDGRRFGVSVDPSEKVDAEYHEECIAQDEDGFCTDYDFSIIFHAYEISGITMTPFPGFEEANIILDTSVAASAGGNGSRPRTGGGGGGGAGNIQRIRASLSIPDAPPRAWLSLAEPTPGVPFLEGDGGDVLVEQLDDSGQPAGLACPLTIRDDGLVYAHLTWWGQCHVADPWGPGVCASAQPSLSNYRDFHHGLTRCADGTDVPTGVLTVGCEHSSAFDAAGVRDHLAHAGMGWASVHITDGQYGPWMSGVLRPGLTETQVAVLRRLSLSGEWASELGGILAVNTPGLPVQRALAASAFGISIEAWKRTMGLGPEVSPLEAFTIPKALRASRVADGKVSRLVGGNLVHRCINCQQRAALGARLRGTDDMLEMVRTMRKEIAVILRRTEHLRDVEAQAARARLSASAR